MSASCRAGTLGSAPHGSFAVPCSQMPSMLSLYLTAEPGRRGAKVTISTPARSSSSGRSITGSGSGLASGCSGCGSYSSTYSAIQNLFCDDWRQKHARRNSVHADLLNRNAPGGVGIDLQRQHSAEQSREHFRMTKAQKFQITINPPVPWPSQPSSSARESRPFFKSLVTQ